MIFTTNTQAMIKIVLFVHNVIVPKTFWLKTSSF